MALTDAERQRRHLDRISSINEDIDKAVAGIDWTRRHSAERSLYDWVYTYCRPLFFTGEIPDRQKEVLDTLESCIRDTNNTMLEISRGAGKTTMLECAIFWAVCTGIKTVPVIVSNTERGSRAIISDFYRILMTRSDLSHDYPYVFLPHQLSQGAARRRQLYNGVETRISKTVTEISLAHLVAKDGKDIPGTGGSFIARSITGAIRGLRATGSGMRPDLVLIDDPQTTQDASSPEQVVKILDTIKRDILPLSGVGRVTAIITATKIAHDDVVCQIERDKNWTTIRFPAIIRYPDDIVDNDGKLWNAYWEIYNRETADEEWTRSESRKYYLDNKEALEAGADVYNPYRYDPEQNFSAIHYLLHTRRIIGERNFDSEYQQELHKEDYALDISPATVCNKTSEYDRLQIPDNAIYTISSWDLNLSKYITNTIVSFTSDSVAYVVYHDFYKCNVDSKLSKAEYDRQVYDVLTRYAKKVGNLGIRIDAITIDANGVPFDPVTEWVKSSRRICGIPAAGFIGKSSHLFNGLIRSRLTNEIRKTVFCGDPQEHVKRGSGKTYTFWDSDFYREMVQRGIVQDAGRGSILLYKARPGDHAEFANHVCNERLKYKRDLPTSKVQYYWISREPHDGLDSLAQAIAAFASQNLSTGEYVGRGTRNVKPRTRTKLRIV